MNVCHCNVGFGEMETSSFLKLLECTFNSHCLGDLLKMEF